MSGDPKRAVGGGLDPSPDMYAIGLRCSQFSMSPAQMTYQREAKRERETMVEELYFYKDATPKGDHYITFVVDLPDRFSESEVLLKVELVSASRTVPIDDFTARGYERVAEQQHLKALPLQSKASLKSPPNVVALVGQPMRFRIEIGSYRQGDRRFAIKCSIAPKVLVERPHLAEVMPCYSPPIYVASKVKRSRAKAAVAARAADDDDEDYEIASAADADDSPAPSSSAAKVVKLDNPDVALADRVLAIETAINQVIVPALQRIEQRLAFGSIADDHAADVLPPLPLDRSAMGRSTSECFIGDKFPQVDDDEFANATGGHWADSIQAMGRGLQEGMDALH